MDITEDAWTFYVREHDGALPSTAFELINFSRTTDKIPILSYNKALIIYEKHTKIEKKLKRSKKKKKKSQIKKSSTKKTRIAMNPDPISMSVTSPILSTTESSSATVTNAKNKTKHKRKASDPHQNTDDINYNIKDRVLLSRDREGIILFIGSVHFTTGAVYGIELQNGSIGKHDGMIDDKRYFKTAEKRAIFVKKKAIRRKMRDKDYNSSSRLRRRHSIESSEKRINSSVVEQMPQISEKAHKTARIEAVPPLNRRRSSSARRLKTFRKRSVKTKSIDDADIFKKMRQSLDDYKYEDENSDWDDIDDEKRKKRKKLKKQSVDDMIIDNYFASKDRVHSRIPQYRRERKYEVANKIPSSFKQYQNSLNNNNKKRNKHKSMIINSATKNSMIDDRRRSSLDLDIEKEPRFMKHAKGSATLSTLNASSNNDKHSRFQSVTIAFSKGWNGLNFNKKKQKALIFGVDPLKLESTLISTKDYASAIPNVLIVLKDALFANEGHLKEGIFRIAPHALKCKEIEKQVNEGALNEIDFDEIDAGLIANLIKIWFRKMPHAILQSVDSSKIEKIQNTKNIQQVRDIIINDMKEANQSYFKWLLDLCVEIVQYEDTNKMSVTNMAVVIAPNLFDPTKIENPMRIMTLSTAAVTFLRIAIEWRKEQNA